MFRQGDWVVVTGPVITSHGIVPKSIGLINQSEPFVLLNNEQEINGWKYILVPSLANTPMAEVFFVSPEGGCCPPGSSVRLAVAEDFDRMIRTSLDAIESENGKIDQWKSLKSEFLKNSQ